MAATVLDLDVVEITPEVEVKLGGKKYVIVAAKADDVLRYRNRLTSAAQERLGMGGRDVELPHNAEAELVAACFFRVNDDDTRIPVPVADVRGLHNRIYRKIWAQLRDISGMADPETLAKN